MAEEVDAGPIHAITRFSIEDMNSEEEVSIEAYGRLLWLAAEMTEGLADPQHRFPELACRWGNRRTRRDDYLELARSNVGRA